ncbi:MAG: hypothetical protein ACKVRO_02215 [Micropepsaceae bacterium]
MKNFARVWLITTGIGAAITMLAPSLIYVAMITIIGIPLALALMLAPLVFIVSLGSWFIGRRLMLGRIGYAIGAGATLLALAIPPHFINAALEKRAALLVAQDSDTLSKGLRARVIAVRNDKPRRFGRGETACDGFCMRALMNGVTERILFVAQDLNEPLNGAMPALSFRLEKRAECPAVELRDGHDEIKDKGRKPKYAHELMQLEIAKGNCLIEETVPLNTADVVLSRGVVHRGESIIAAGLDPTADTVKASRVSVHERQGRGFVETYRLTGVVTYLLWPVLAPTAEGAAEFRAYAVLARTASRKNLVSRYESEPDWSAFLTGTLGLDLALRDGAAEEATRQILADGIAKPAPVSDGAVKLSADFIDGISRRRKMSAAEYPIARSVLTDTRFNVPRSAWAAVRYATDADDAYFEAIAASMFLRLASIADTDDGKRYPVWGDEVRYIGGVIRELPAATILKHRADLDWLAAQERLRVWAHEALGRLNEFGADAAPKLLWLMDEAVRLKDAYDSDWNNIYVSGLTGLCRMGEAGRAMIQPIYERLNSGVMVKHASYWDLTIQTLTGMGADPDEMWGHLQTGDRNHTRQRFSREVARAQKKRDCSY